MGTPTPALAAKISPHGHEPVLLILIAVMKLVKGTLLLLVGFELLRLVGHNVHDTIVVWARHIRVDPENKHVHALLEKTLGITDGKLELYSVGTFIYAGLYLTEGVGLLLDKLWAEWMTVITTAGFVPLEIYEICWHPGHRLAAKVILFAVNVLVLWYLVRRIGLRHQARKQAEARAKIAAETAPSGGPMASGK